MAHGRGTFGLVSSRGARGSNFRGGYRGRGGSSRGGRGRGRGGVVGSSSAPSTNRADDGTQLEARFEEVQLRDEVDEKLGFARFTEGPRRIGWLVNMHPVSRLEVVDWAR
jgi:DNA polymerase epsilon subunit 1